MISTLFSEMFQSLSTLPWLSVVIGAAAAYFFGWFWYGVLFRERYMSLTGNKGKKTNCLVVWVQILGLFVLAYFIAILSIFPIAMFLLSIDALIGVILFLTLAGFLFQYGNTSKAMGSWLISGGYGIAAIALMATIIWNM